MSRSPRPKPVALTPPSNFLLALEARAGFEFGALAFAWPWLRKAPRGDGHPVLVLPGMIAGDVTTLPLRLFLQQLGYEAYPWELGLNVGPRQRLVEGLVKRVRELHEMHGRRLSLVGWSLGGVLSCALAARMPKRIRQVITLGSPHRVEPHSSKVGPLFEWLSGYNVTHPHLARIFTKPMQQPLTSILSRSDGVLNWRTSLVDPGPLRENIEVNASHFGLGVNPTVLWAIADRLAQAEGQWAPFRHSGHWRELFFRDASRVPLSDLMTR